MPSTIYRKDRELTRACVDGDADSWERFVHQYGRLIVSTVGTVRRSFDRVTIDAEDVTSHVYEKLLEDGCRRIRAWRGKAKFSTYLVQVVRRLAVDLLKQEVRRGRGIVDGAEIEELGEAPAHAEAEERELRRAALYTALNDLPPKQAIILRMRLEGKPLREIATLLDRPVGTVSVENSRALERMRRTLRATMNNEELT